MTLYMNHANGKNRHLDRANIWQWSCHRHKMLAYMSFDLFCLAYFLLVHPHMTHGTRIINTLILYSILGCGLDTHHFVFYFRRFGEGHISIPE